jgi:hypothetical protein
LGVSPAFRALLVFVIVSSAACQHQPPSNQAAPDAGAETGKAQLAKHGSAVLMVENHHFTDVVVYLINGGQRMRVGMVRSVGSKTFEIPQRMIGRLGSFHLLADPIGEPRILDSGVISMRPGVRVEWVLESSLETSSVAVY